MNKATILVMAAIPGVVQFANHFAIKGHWGGGWGIPLDSPIGFPWCRLVRPGHSGLEVDGMKMWYICAPPKLMSSLQWSVLSVIHQY